MDAKVLKILERIHAHRGQAYLVGGCVRDDILKRVPNDYDVVTDLRPNVLVDLFKDMHTNLVGESFGVVKVDDVDVATFRKDVYSASTIHTKGADSVKFADTIEEDLSRRDFTMNAIALRFYFDGERHNCTLVDPFNGVADIRNMVIRFVGNPADRIVEDPCRMLRALRFASTLGFAIEPRSHSAMECYHEALKLVDKERVRLELMKVLEKADKPSHFFRSLSGLNMLRDVLPSLDYCMGVEQNKYHGEDVFTHCVLACDAVSKKYPFLRLAALMHDVGKPDTKSSKDGEVHFFGHENYGPRLVARDLGRLRFSKDDAAYVIELVEKHMFFFNEVATKSAYRRFMANLKVPVKAVLRLRLADRAGNLAKRHKPLMTKAFKKTLRMVVYLQHEDKLLKLSDLALDGHDLMDMGYKPGPFFSKALRHCLNLCLENPSKNEKEYLKKIVKELPE